MRHGRPHQAGRPDRRGAGCWSASALTCSCIPLPRAGRLTSLDNTLQHDHHHPDRGRRDQRGQLRRRAGRPGRGIVVHRGDGDLRATRSLLAADHERRRGSAARRPSPRSSSACAWASCRTTSTPPRSSWATPARCCIGLVLAAVAIVDRDAGRPGAVSASINRFPVILPLLLPLAVAGAPARRPDHGGGAPHLGRHVAVRPRPRASAPPAAGHRPLPPAQRADHVRVDVPVRVRHVVGLSMVGVPVLVFPRGRSLLALRRAGDDGRAAVPAVARGGARAAGPGPRRRPARRSRCRRSPDADGRVPAAPRHGPRHVARPSVAGAR